MKKQRRKNKRSRRDLKALIDKRKKGEPIDFGPDEVTDIIDLSLERTKRTAKECQDRLSDTTEDLKTLRKPAEGPTEVA